LLLGAGIWVYFTIKNFKKPYLVRTDTILRISASDTADGETTVRVVNPNNFEIRIDSLHYTMSINGKQYLRGGKEHPIVLKANDTDVFVLPYRVNMKQMGIDTKDSKKTLNKFNLEGYVSAKGIKRLHLKIPYEKEVTVLKNPELTANEDILNINQDGIARTNVELRLYNPNDYPIKIDSLKYSLYIQGKRYMKGHRLKTAILEPLKSETYNLPLEIYLKKIMKDFKYQDSALHKFYFDGYLSTPEMKPTHITIPFEKKMAIVKDFGAKLDHIKLEKLTFKEADLIATLKVENKNAMEFDVHHVHYDLYVENEHWASGDYEKDIVLKKKSDAEVDLPIHLDLSQIKHNIKDYIKGDKKQNYALTLSMLIRTHGKKMKDIKMILRPEGRLSLKKAFKKNKQKS
jgi:LEA14-like dessication related protein